MPLSNKKFLRGSSTAISQKELRDLSDSWWVGLPNVSRLGGGTVTHGYICGMPLDPSMPKRRARLEFLAELPLVAVRTTHSRQ